LSKTNKINHTETSPKFFIDKECKWFFKGTEIKRHPMVCLFSRYLRLNEVGQYFITTPYEKEQVIVEDVPFKITSIWAKGERDDAVIHLQTNVGDELILNSNKQIRFLNNKINHGVIPYVTVRDNIEAYFTRSCALDLFDLCNYHEIDNASCFGFWSNKEFFPIELINDNYN
jgi:hypothetical protein